MNVPRHATLIKRMCDARVKQLRAATPVLAASLVTIEKTCGRPGCHCQAGEKHSGNYLTYKEAGKTRTVYVPLEMLEDTKAWVAEHQRMKKLSQEISRLAIAQIRGHVTTRRQKAGRP
jgi:hypothetical protein